MEATVTQGRDLPVCHCHFHPALACHKDYAGMGSGQGLEAITITTLKLYQTLKLCKSLNGVNFDKL